MTNCNSNKLYKVKINLNHFIKVKNIIRSNDKINKPINPISKNCCALQDIWRQSPDTLNFILKLLD